LQNFSFQLPTYQGSVLEAFRRTKHGLVAKRQLVLQQAQEKEKKRNPRRTENSDNLLEYLRGENQEYEK
jgi:hypothetical protein